MPTYEYQCQKCGKRHEALQSITAKPLTTCPKPKCTGKLKRLLSRGAGFLFKGSGFYITDYRSDNYKAGAKKESDAASPKKETAPVPKETKKAAKSSDS